ncbi:MAG: hypothetical protein IKT07_08060, partial [Oscillospiraceae bacterium]|nr:hypothetical protein [Oscillospiraceae bacterium]
MKNGRKQLAIALILALCLSRLPVPAFADGTITSAGGTIAAAEAESEIDFVEFEEENGQGLITAAESDEVKEEETEESSDSIQGGKNRSGRISPSLSKKDVQTSIMRKNALRATANDKVYFSSFEELQELIEDPELEATFAIYPYSQDFTMSADITLPANLQVYFYFCSVTIPEEVTVTIASGSMLIAKELIVDGTLNNSGELFGGYPEWSQGTITYKPVLTVNGTLNNTGIMDYPYEITGLDNIIGDGTVYIECLFGSDAELTDMLGIAAADTNTNHYYDFYAINDLSIEADHEFAPDCSLFIWGEIVTIENGAEVTLTDTLLQINCEGTLTLTGTLINDGTVEVYDAYEDEDTSYGRSFLIVTGGYTGTGVLLVESPTKNEIFSSFI